MTTQGKFFALDGVEGSGKSTQIKLLVDYLERVGYPVLLTKEPGEKQSRLCQELRELLLNRGTIQISPLPEFLIFEADRVEHCATVIAPALAQNQIVICDRFNAATYAYQIYGGNIEIDDFLALDEAARQGITPNLYIYIDLDPIVGLQRNISLGTKNDHFEQKELEYHRRVRQGFSDFFSFYQGDQLIIPGTLSIEEIQTTIRQTVKQYLS